MTDQLSRLNPSDQLANADVHIKVSIVDGMAEVQALEKPDWIKTFSDLADHFTVTIFDNYRDADEICHIFDRFVTPADIYLVTFLFILVIITYINGHVILLLGMMYHCLSRPQLVNSSGRLGTYQLQDYLCHSDFQGILSTVIHPKTMILFTMYYKKNRARYRGKDTKTRTPFLMQVPMKRLLAHVSTKDELTDAISCQQDSREGMSEWFARGGCMEQ